MAPRKWGCLPLWLAKAVHAYERLQVELHGKYSVERVAEVHAYERTFSTRQCLFVLLATPLPCLAVIVLTDLVPLNPPEDGYARNGVLWARIFVVAFSFVATIFEQLRRFVVGLPMSTRVLWIASMVIAASSTAYGYWMASFVGFPLPFTVLMCTPCSGSLLVVTGLVLWWPLLRRSSRIRQDTLTFVKIVAVQFALTTVYPAYNFLFVKFTGFEQTVFALLLPVLKLVIKNVLALVFSPRLEDFKPEVVIFNVEVFHALFVSFCMQSSTSWMTTIALMSVDFIHARFSLRDVDTLLHKIVALEAKLAAAQANVDVAYNGKSNHQVKTMTLIEKAMYFVHHDEAVGRVPEIRLKSLQGDAGLAAVFPASFASDIVGPVHARRSGAMEPVFTASSSRTRSLLTSAPSRQELLRVSSVLSLVPEDTHQVLSVLTTDERVAYVTTTLQVLHIAEFLVLIEFVEGIIPVVYCVYLTAMFYLPNRVYYPQLAHMDAHSLFSTIGNVLGYAALEFVSFVGLSWALRRRLQLSPVHQLAFVLHSQWNLVQAKLILWVMFAVQISLQHFGYDYSFRFQWLHT